ncbi:hypothetical protein HOD30_04360 [Candidatus Peregrinibacteria bacterium]|jgi:hypothetical protein|nr:hypothetical protein [Candidatus Peregrinibacteria bacterium]MBT4631790.1 hypothetical protein [Candidatus Peregrinibacteria bacterium]MBT5516853.1 hypothetical protein [Candidatus Peregrinibacteria bacterium]MBT5824485.1 hypothetical protein [Candidatus Peregrinibacteria bacterium]
MAKTKKHIKVKIRIPHLIIDGRAADPKLLDELAPGLRELDARVRVLGKGAKSIPHAFSAEEALEEASIWVILGDELPSEFPMLVERGVVPVMLRGVHPDAENYNASAETGNAFLFPKANHWHIYGTIVRALENFTFSYDWESLKNQGKDLLDV